MNSLGEQGKKQAKVEYNPDGSTKSVTDRLGNRTAFEYDERGLLVREVSPSSATVYTYDNVGRIKGVRVGSPANQTKETATQYAEYEYSEAGRKVKVTCGGAHQGRAHQGSSWSWSPGLGSSQARFNAPVCMDQEI